MHSQHRVVVKVLAVAMLLLAIGSAHGDNVLYEFSGVLPVGASFRHSQVDDGESWIAIFDVDTSVADSNSSPDIGVYSGSVLSGEIQFSGGYSQQLNVNGWQTVVWDNIQANNERIDGISIRNFQGTTPFPVFQAVSDSDTFAGDDLKASGFFFDSGNVDASEDYFQLYFSDQLNPREIVAYNSASALNVSFRSSIPEPTSASWIVVVCAFVLRVRFRSAFPKLV